MDVQLIKEEGKKDRVRVFGIGLEDGRRLMPIASSMEGAKHWLKEGGFSFEATPINLELFQRAFPDARIAGAKAPPPPAPVAKAPPITYFSRRTNYRHQQRALDKWGNLSTFALFMEMGTGKTKVAIDKAGMYWCERMITGVLVVGKRGVHEDWIDEHLPVNIGTMVPWFGWAWDKRPLPTKLFQRDRLQFFSINIDALKTKKGEAAALDFIRAHGGNVFMIIDESQDIKNPSAKRTLVCCALGALCRYRAIMTGTPLAKNLLDVWSQFKFLDERIIGMRYQITFKSEFCQVDRVSHLVVGAKNVERFYNLIDNWHFRITKEEELDLPPKNYDTHSFEMSDNQRRHYDELKATFMTQLDSGERMTVAHTATMFMRLQQITCGIITDDDGTIHHLNDNPRLDALRDVLEARQGKTIIWARFQHDIEQIVGMLGERAVASYGPTSITKRREAKARFLNPNSGVDYWCSNPQLAAGIDQLQGDCRTAIFYSNSFNAIERWQSEDRIHRIGTVATVTYIDLICKGSVDRRIVANLRAKKSLSDLLLDDIRKVLEAA